MIGTTLGQYRILEEIGRGGMAVVYKAYQPALDRTVAMKVLPPELSLDYQFVQRFAREARSAAKLTHPHIVTIHELDQTEGNHFIVMEYVDGPSMADLLMREGALPPPQAAQILAQVGSALDYAHRQAFVHRDIKPANILLGPGETAKLTDFGIVKAADGTSLTRTGTLLGTPAYMSPEQARGTTITRSTDVYSLGVVAYEMLSGRVPFTGDTAAVLHAHAYDPPDLAVLPPVVQQVVGGALEKDPEKRFQSAGAFSHALTGAVAGAVAGELAGGPRVGSPDQSAAPSRGLPGWLWGALGVSAALLITAVILAVWLVNRWGVLRTETPDLAEGTEIHQAAAVREMEAREAAPVNPAAAMVITSTVPPRETSSPTPVPTETPTVTPPPTETPDPTPAPCSVVVYSGFSGIWASAEQRLGCPVQAARVSQWVAEEAFERGRMFWREDNRKIYVLYQTGTWQRFDDTWNEHTDPEFACGPPKSPPTPKRGFGKVWCARADVRSGVGNAVEEEHGDLATVQDFAGGGVILRVTSGTYVLFGDGVWERR